MNYKAILIALFCLPVVEAKSQTRGLNSHVETAWVTVPVGVGPDKENVTIRPGHVISLDTAANADNLIINKGAALNSMLSASDGKQFTLMAGLKTDTAVIINDGVFGDDNNRQDGIGLLLPATIKQFLIKGEGTSTISSLTASGGSNLTVEIAQDLNLNSRGKALSLEDQNLTVLIDKYKTLKLIDQSGEFQASPATGVYNYVINGTLDLGNTMVNQAIAAISKDTKVTLNINGILKLGSGLSTNGKVTFIIADGGLTDATNTTTLNLGDNYFATQGSGALLRKVGSTGVSFPVGTLEANSANGLTLTNTTGESNFRVSIKQAEGTNIADTRKLVNKQWTITPDNAVSNFNLSVSPNWRDADQEGDFTVADPVSVAHFNGAGWDKTDAISNRYAQYYTANAGGFTTGGIFAVVNRERGFEIYPNPSAAQVTVSHPEAGAGATMNITTLYGKTVFETAVHQGDKSTVIPDVAKLDKGVYVLQYNNNGQKYTTKLIKN